MATNDANVDERAEEAINHLEDARESLQAAGQALDDGPHALYPDSMYASSVLADDVTGILGCIEQRRSDDDADDDDGERHTSVILERADI